MCHTAPHCNLYFLFQCSTKTKQKQTEPGDYLIELKTCSGVFFCNQQLQIKQRIMVEQLHKTHVSPYVTIQNLLVEVHIQVRSEGIFKLWT